VEIVSNKLTFERNISNDGSFPSYVGPL